MLSFKSEDFKLPSLAVPYEVNKINMEPFGVKEIMMLSRSLQSGSWAPVVDALDSVLDYNVRQLTDGDFYYLLAVQRLLGYSISPLIATWECQGVLFKETEGEERTLTHAQVRALVREYDEATEEEKEELIAPDDLQLVKIPCNHHNSHTITLKDLFVVELDPQPLPEGLDYPRVDTMVDAFVATANGESDQIIQAARWVKDGDTLEEKMDILSNSKDLSLFELALQTDIKIRYGISQLIAVPCEKCGQLSEHTFTIGPETFFDV